MKIEVVKGTYNSNTFVCSFGDKVIIIDSGATLDDIKKAVANKKVLAVLLTHEHFDHVTNCVAYSKHFQVPLYGAREALDNLKYYRAELPSEEEEGVVYPIVLIDDTVKFNVIADEKVIDIAGIKVQPYICQGHSAGSVVYQIADSVFMGDLLFARGVGNVYMTNGKKYLLESLARMQDLTFKTAYHGHGEPSDYEGQQKNIRVWLKWLSR